MENKQWLKLNEVEKLTVKNVVKSFYQKWDADKKEYLKSEQYLEGYSKRHVLECDEGMVNISNGQLSSLFLACANRKETGVSDIRGAIVKVSTNGKTGIEIRYFFNFVGYGDEEINVEDEINF